MPSLQLVLFPAPAANLPQRLHATRLCGSADDLLFPAWLPAWLPMLELQEFSEVFPHLITATDVPSLCKIDDVEWEQVDAGGCFGARSAVLVGGRTGRRAGWLARRLAVGVCLACAQSVILIVAGGCRRAWQAFCNRCRLAAGAAGGQPQPLAAGPGPAARHRRQSHCTPYSPCFSYPQACLPACLYPHPACSLLLPAARHHPGGAGRPAGARQGCGPVRGLPATRRCNLCRVVGGWVGASAGVWGAGVQCVKRRQGCTVAAPQWRCLLPWTSHPASAGTSFGLWAWRCCLSGGQHKASTHCCCPSIMNPAVHVPAPAAGMAGSTRRQSCRRRWCMA